ncbi:MAG: ATP-binding protein, partial [Paenisporosarcina sp.]
MSILIGSKRHQVIDFLFQESQDPMIIMCPNNKWNEFNNAAKKLFGQDMISGVIDMLDKTSQQIWFDFLDEVILKTTASCQLIVRHLTQREPITTKVSGYFDAQLKEVIIYFKIQPSQITTNIYYADFFKHAKNGLILSDLSGTIIDINHQVEDYFSLKKEHVIGLPVMQINMFFKDSTREIESFYQALKAYQSAEMILRRIEKNSSEKYYHFKTSYNELNKMYLTVIQDYSELMNLRKQANHVDSLSTLGQLAASIAHEIRNPMTSLKGFTQLLNQTVTEDGKRYIQVIEDELNRMDEILNEFLVLSKPTNRTKQYVCITSLLNQVIQFMQPQAIMYSTIIHFEQSENKENFILGDSYELKKVFINIFKNAIEEMPNGGIISITQSLTNDNKIKISISDDGKGMSQEQIHQVFMPFYTTKPNGTGLGLSHAIQTIENHGGYIEIESELQIGTTLNLFLPLYHIKNNPSKNVIDSFSLNANN